MKVGVNLRYLHRQITGIERELFEEIIALDKLESDLTLVGYMTDRDYADSEVEKSLEKCKRLQIKKSKFLHEDKVTRLIWDMYHLGKVASDDKIDIFWGPSYSIPISLTCPSVVTIHDLAYEYFPHAYTPTARLWLRIIPKITVRKASRIITISENSKKDIVRFLDVDSDRIDVVPLACNSNFRFLPESKMKFRNILRKYGINSPYILTVSQISPRKNLDILIKAFGKLKKGQRFLHKLVIVGGNAWLHNSVYETVKSEGLTNEIIFTGHLSDTELVAFYNMADLFAFPSLYEGFGLTVLEAMSCGLPVICTNTSSLPEVVGDAGILIPPNDVDSLVSTILELLSKPFLLKELRERGLQKAAGYSWESTAQHLSKIFTNLKKDSQAKI